VYDTAGNLKKVVDTLKGIKTAEYSTGIKLTKLTDTGRRWRSQIYSLRKRSVTLLQSQTAACGNTTVYTYDASGRIETVTDGEENVVSLGYDAYGNLSAITDGTGNTITLAYNGYGEIYIKRFINQG